MVVADLAPPTGAGDFGNGAGSPAGSPCSGGKLTSGSGTPAKAAAGSPCPGDGSSSGSGSPAGAVRKEKITHRPAFSRAFPRTEIFPEPSGEVPAQEPTAGCLL